MVISGFSGPSGIHTHTSLPSASCTNIDNIARYPVPALTNDLWGHLSPISGVVSSTSFGFAIPVSLFLWNDLERLKNYDITVITSPESAVLFLNSNPVNFLLCTPTTFSI